MAVPIKVPSPGESVTEGFISVWYKKNGDFVRAEEPVFELESDKVPIKVPAPATGVLNIDVPEGQKVQVGAVVGRIDEKAAARPAAAPDAAPGAGPATAGPKPEVVLSPAARQLAADQQIDPRKLSGTGRGGRITKEDVLAHVANNKVPEKPPVAPVEPEHIEQSDGKEEPALKPLAPIDQAPEPAPPGPAAPATRSPGAAEREKRVRMTAIRQRIAERLLSAQQNAAILTTFNEADMTAIANLRTRYKESFQKKHGVGLGFMSFFVKAVVEALKQYPMVNARIDGADIVFQNYYDIGVAVSTEKGLMVPVLRDCDKLNFAGIEKGIAELAKKAREGKITVADLQGGTFTITNGGIFGSLLSTPILNPPQSGILGMHAIQKRPVVVDDQVVVRPMMYLAMSYDHRIIDGREAVSFLVRVKECLENPDRLLLEI